MNKQLKIFSALILFTLLTPLAGANPTSDEKSPRFLVHLLDYLAKDYGGAVSHGRVVSASEYREQVEFAESAVKLGGELREMRSDREISSDLPRLDKLIREKASEAEVASLARSIQARVISLSGIEIAPTRWPSLKRGRDLFAKNCVACHGASGAGDGPAGAALNPKPANFLNASRMNLVSPFQAFNSIRLGIPGTAMAPFHGLSDAEVWDLAFLTVSLRHKPVAPPAGTRFESQELTLIASLSDEKLKSALPGDKNRKKDELIAALRLHSGNDGDGGTLLFAKSQLEDAARDFEAGKKDSALSKALRAYLEGVEPVEARLRANDPGLVAELESRMAGVRSAIEQNDPVDVVKEKFALAFHEIDEAAGLLKSGELSPWMTFTAAAAVLLREGFEAVIIVLALLSVIRAAGSRRAALWVHGGWITAVGCGVLAWLFSDYLIRISGAGRELLEATISLFAVAVLLIVGFWLHSQTEIGRWRAFIHTKVRRALEGRNLFGLASISFVAVFREAFETVLFLRAIWLESGEPAKSALTAGVVTSFIAVLVMAWAILRFSAKLPIRKLFAGSALVMALLAIILTGKGLHSFQETGLLRATPLPLIPESLRFGTLGLYPTSQTLIAQVLIIGISLLLWYFGSKPSRQPNPAAQA